MKRTVSLGLVISLVFSLLIWGTNNAASVKITFSRHGTETDLETENKLVKIFKSKHPDIDVEVLVLPWNDYNTKIPVMVAGGSAPDVISAHPALLFQIYAAKGLYSINSMVKTDTTINYDDIVFPGDAKFSGQIVGLPQKSCTHILRYNEDLFKKAGLTTPSDLYYKGKEKAWNWDSLIEAAKKLTVDENGDGQPEQYGVSLDDNCIKFSTIRSAGGDVLDKALTKCVLNSPGGKKAFQFFVDLVRKYKVAPPPELQVGQLGIQFKTGKIAIEAATSCDSVRDLRKGYELPFSWKFVVPPAGPAGFRVWGDTDQMIISITSKNKKAAYEWMKFRSSKEAWVELYKEGMTLAFTDGPTRFSIFDIPAFKEPLKAVDVNMIKEAYKYVIPNPFLPRTPYADRIFFTIVPTELDNAMRGTKSVEQAINDAVKLINDVLAGKA
jgi:multiple sugar transport system substrate-binding protein